MSLQQVASRRFLKEFSEFSRGYRNLDRILRDFLSFRISARPDQPFGKKDYPFRNGHLRGFRHFHMVHGKAILVYQISEGQLRLCCMCEHKTIDGIPSQAFTDYLQGLTEADFSPMEMEVAA